MTAADLGPCPLLRGGQAPPWPLGGGGNTERGLGLSRFALGGRNCREGSPLNAPQPEVGTGVPSLSPGGAYTLMLSRPSS